MGSILTSVKKMLGITEEYEHFDMDLIMHINSVFVILNQMGVGPTNTFAIHDSSTTWDEFTLGDNRIDTVKSYMYMKVRLMFDPPQSSIVMDALNRNITELEWRLNIVAEKPNNEED